MSPYDLAKQCADVITERTRLGIGLEDAAILVVTPRGWKAPPKFPRGEIVQWKENGDRVRYFPAIKTLAWCIAFAGVKVQGLPTAIAQNESERARPHK